jgi:uncharacterized protein
MVVSGRLIAGLTIPILILADAFAIRWYSDERRTDVLKPLVPSVIAGFVLGTAFYVVIGSGGRVLDVMIAVIVLAMVAIQSFRMIRGSEAVEATPALTNSVGALGGFTTFVANAAGPVLNTYFTGLGLPKLQMMGTSAVFYFAVNLAKVPVYALIGLLASGGPFFTAASLGFNAALVPAVLAGVYGGRWLLPRIPQRTFTILVLVFSAAASIRLLVN